MSRKGRSDQHGETIFNIKGILIPKYSIFDTEFKSEFSWKRHQENDEIHKRIENYTPFLTCQVCGKQFERRRRWCLDQHMLTHQPDKKYPCNICGKYFRSPSYLLMLFTRKNVLIVEKYLPKYQF